MRLEFSSLWSTTIQLHDGSFHVRKLTIGLGPCQPNCLHTQVLDFSLGSQSPQRENHTGLELWGKWWAKPKIFISISSLIESAKHQSPEGKQTSFPLAPSHVDKPQSGNDLYIVGPGELRGSELWIQYLRVLLSSLALAWLSPCCWHPRQEN